MRRRQIFIDETAGESVVLPVTPDSYAWENGINVEQVTIDGLGDINLAGYKKLDTRSIECLFPAWMYPFCEPEARIEPYWYVEWFERRCQARTPLRYIVAGTPLNASVLIESIRYGEEDGTNDLYVTITLRQYRTTETPEAVTATAESGSALARETGTAVTATQSYTVATGDTLWAICRRFYGDPYLYDRLAAANGVRNPDLIYPGQVLTILPAEQLPMAGTLPRSSQTARNTSMTWDAESGTWTAELEGGAG